MPIDKEALYGNFDRSMERKQKLEAKMIHKAMDLPVDDDVHINTNNGLSNKSLALILAGIITAGALPLIVQHLKSPVKQSETIFPVTAPPVDSSYSVLFYNKDQELINIPQKEQDTE